MGGDRRIALGLETGECLIRQLDEDLTALTGPMRPVRSVRWIPPETGDRDAFMPRGRIEAAV